MVKDSAKILSGYTVDWGKTYAAKYDTTRHTTGAVSVLGFSDANAAADGQAVTLAYLKYLAHHPATASHLCRKLATYFVSDSPSDELVASLAQVYLDSGTDMKAVLRTLALHPEFLTSEGQKVRTPVRRLGRHRPRPRHRRAAARTGGRLRLQRQLDPRRSRARSPGRARTDRRSSDAMWSSASRVFAVLRHAPQPRRRLVAEGA